MTLSNIFKLNDQFHDSAALHFSVQVKLFDTLTKKLTAKEVATTFSWSFRKTEITLNLLTSLDLISKDSEGYINTTTTNEYLVSSSENYVGAIIEHQRLQWDMWSNIKDSMASMSVRTNLQEVKLGEDEEANVAFNNAMIQLSKGNIKEYQKLDFWDDAKKVVDICGGHGTYLATILADHPHLTGEVWDLETTQSTARETFKKYNVENRASCITTQLNDVDWNKDLTGDIFMLNDCLHYFELDAIQDVFNKVYEKCSLGGKVLVSSMYLDDRGITPSGAAGFSFHMMLNTENGGLQPTIKLEGALAKSGFKVESRKIGESNRVSLLIGTKS